MKIIIVDDSKEYLTQVRRLLASVWPDVEVTEYDAEQQGQPGADFDWSIYDALIIDYQLGSTDTGLDWLQKFRASPGFPPAILMTVGGDEYVAAKAIKLGAADFIKKADIDAERLPKMITEAVTEHRARHPEYEQTVNAKLEQDAAVFREVKAPAQRHPDGKRIGYRFVRLIGQGANSRVYLAERFADRQTLVLKIIDVATIKDPQAFQRFVREAELISAIDTPYVVKFLGYGFTQTYGYIAMEFFTRGDLKQRIEHAVSLEDAMNYIKHIALGLSAIHACGVVHRDLKPGNIMFRSDDSLALADFGISRRLEETNEITRAGSVLGTPNYISPEQAVGAKVDQRADLYSAGVIFFEMLAGRKPYKADNAPALVYQHVHAAVPVLPNDLRQFQPIIDLLLAKDPNDRFNSAEEFLDALAASSRV